MMTGLRLQQLKRLHIGPVDLEIEAGQCVGISGASGSGKTQLLRAIVDLDEHEGEVFLGDQGCQDMPAPDWRKQVALVPAESEWWLETAGAHMKQVDGDLVIALGLNEDHLRRPISQLSTGERQRLALARVLVLKPKALLLDEPSASVDKDNTLKLEALLADYQREHNIPILWISHEKEQLKRVSQKHFQLKDGKLQEQVL